MDTIPSHCGSMMQSANSDIKLCEPLEQLKMEHIPLREKMVQFYVLAKSIGADIDVSNWKIQLMDLREKVIAFIDELELHSIREEEVLFPLMAGYIGRQAGPIAVMEYEHEQAKRNLKSFMETVNKADISVEQNEAKTIVAYLINAYTILSDHFMKEELVLFPMAEQMLSLQEKEQLSQKFQQIQ